VNKKCGDTHPKNIFYLKIDPELNLKNITTRINKPCIVKRTATLKLRVATKNDHRYYSIGTFSVHPLSSAGAN
jgi:hypothetical protein